MCLVLRKCWLQLVVTYGDTAESKMCLTTGIDSSVIGVTDIWEYVGSRYGDLQK